MAVATVIASPAKEVALNPDEGKPEGGEDIGTGGKRLRNKNKRVGTLELSDSDRQRYGIKPHEDVAWVRNPEKKPWSDMGEDRVQELKDSMEGRVPVDEKGKSRIWMDSVMMAVNSEYQVDAQKEIDADMARMESKFQVAPTGSKGALIIEEDSMVDEDPRAQKARMYDEYIQHERTGMIGPTAHIKGTDVERVLAAGIEFTGGEEAAMAEKMRYINEGKRTPADMNEFKAIFHTKPDRSRNTSTFVFGTGRSRRS